MPRIICLRHSSYAKVDGEYVLDNLGKDQAKAAAQALLERFAWLDNSRVRVISSPTKRAHQTSEIIALALNSEPEVSDSLKEFARIDDRIEFLKGILSGSDTEVVILVTHMPVVEQGFCHIRELIAAHDWPRCLPEPEYLEGWMVDPTAKEFVYFQP